MSSAAAALRRVRPSIKPAQSLLAGFILLTSTGALLLALPIASRDGTIQPFVDAFFTATSAVTTTGLVVVDTGSYYTLFGQIVILVLFQVGGLGYMVFIAFVALLMGRKLSLSAGVALQESVAGFARTDHHAFIASVFRYTLLFEALGAAVLSVYWMRDFPVWQALYLGVFHSVSAFCTAGFSLFSDSFINYRDSAVINATIAVVTVAGGIGFFVLRDLSRYLVLWRGNVPRRRLSLHTKLTLAVSLPLMIAGSGIVLLAEPDALLGSRHGQRLAASTFQGLSASTTTGFNSVDIGSMSATSLFALVILMFVGASPGGTGGGIKTTTLGTVLATVKALLQGREDAVAFRRRLPVDTVHRALTIGLLATVLVTIDTLLLTVTEQKPFLQILFEVVSAFGTVGLSAGITSSLSTTGKVVLSITMLIGRLGPLAIGFALLARPRAPRYRCAEDKVFIG